MGVKIFRAVISQPSTLQTLHHLDGEMCIAAVDDNDSDFATIYFTSGDVHNMRVPRITIRRIKLSSAEN